MSSNWQPTPCRLVGFDLFCTLLHSKSPQSVKSDGMCSLSVGGKRRLHEVGADQQPGNKYLTAAGRVNSELLAKAAHSSLVPPVCRQQKSIRVLCEVQHGMPRSLQQTANESHRAERRQELQDTHFRALTPSGFVLWGGGGMLQVCHLTLTSLLRLIIQDQTDIFPLGDLCYSSCEGQQT